MSEGRKLASIQRVGGVRPIPGADAIEAVDILGWTVVSQKGNFKPGDLAVYFEIDSFLPETDPRFSFLSKKFTNWGGLLGHRLRTIRLRGQLSQGLALPLTEFQDITDTLDPIEVGTDVTDVLGIKLWEPILPAQLAGKVRGSRPHWIPKTDQERVQNLVKEISLRRVAFPEEIFEVTEKLDGSSMTVYIDYTTKVNEDWTAEMGEDALLPYKFGVCSRNLDLEEDENNAFWKAARRPLEFGGDLEELMSSAVLMGEMPARFALRGELVGPGIQGNPYKLRETEFRVYDIWDGITQRNMTPQDRSIWAMSWGLQHVPIYGSFKLSCWRDVNALLEYADGSSALNEAVMREGVVLKSRSSGFTFKAVSNAYLLGEK